LHALATVGPDVCDDDAGYGRDILGKELENTIKLGLCVEPWEKMTNRCFLVVEVEGPVSIYVSDVFKRIKSA
jgi:hypothetical protein